MHSGGGATITTSHASPSLFRFIFPTNPSPTSPRFLGKSRIRRLLVGYGLFDTQKKQKIKQKTNQKNNRKKKNKNRKME
jgi:hypothetical protein